MNQKKELNDDIPSSDEYPFVGSMRTQQAIKMYKRFYNLGINSPAPNIEKLFEWLLMMSGFLSKDVKTALLYEEKITNEKSLRGNLLYPSKDDDNNIMNLLIFEKHSSSDINKSSMEECGRLFLNNGKMDFIGDVHKSAKDFLEHFCIITDDHLNAKILNKISE